MCNIPTIDDRN